MLRRLTLSALVGAAMAIGVVAVAQPGSDFGKSGKGKKDKGNDFDKLVKERAKAEKWAIKLQSADPKTADRWMAEKATKEQMKAEKIYVEDQEKAYKMALKSGSVEPPAKDEEKPDPRPTVLRYGNLPKELPAWWADVDADKDVQLSLYEWRTAGKKVEEFVALDSNTDGFLTVEEYLRATTPDGPRKK